MLSRRTGALLRQRRTLELLTNLRHLHRSLPSLQSWSSPPSSRGSSDGRSSIFSFFKLREEANRPSLQNTTEQFVKAVQRRFLPAIHAAYAELSQFPQRHPPQQKKHFERWLTQAMAELSTSSISHDANLVRTIFDDMQSKWLAPITIEHHRYVVASLVLTGRRNEALEWLSSVSDEYPGIKPTSTEWNVVIKGFADAGDASGIDAAISRAVKQGIDRKTLPRPTIQKASVAYRPRDISDWNATIRRTAKEQDLDAAYALVRSMRSAGVKANSQTLRPFVESASTVAELREQEDRIGATADWPEWSPVIQNAAEQRGGRAALEIYEEAKTNGIRPSGALVFPIIKKLCSGAVRPPSWKDITTALDLYEEASTYNLGSLTTVHASGASAGLYDARIYNCLLRALASHGSRNHEPFARAYSLLQEMRDRGVSMDSMTATSLAILLMRAAPSYRLAYEAYRAFAVPTAFVTTPQLDEVGYTAVISAFCSLDISPGDGKGSLSVQGRYPPPDLYFEMVRDMQERGYSVTPHIYSALLARFSKLAQHIRNVVLSDKSIDASEYPTPEAIPSLRALLSAVKETHNHITLSTYFTPDTALLNSLLDAYQRTYAFTDAVKVWDTLRLARMYDNTTISIMMDTCGFMGAEHLAVNIWSKLVADDWDLNKQNWDAWVECLCRLGQLDEALRVVCLEMTPWGERHYAANLARSEQSESSPVDAEVVKPDRKTINILLSFASRANRIAEVEEKLQKYLPHLMSNSKT